MQRSRNKSIVLIKPTTMDIASRIPNAILFIIAQIAK